MPSQRAQLVTLRALTPPAELKITWNRILQLLQQQITLLDQIQVAAKSGATVGEVTKLVKLLNSASTEGQQRSVALGLTNCGT